MSTKPNGSTRLLKKPVYYPTSTLRAEREHLATQVHEQDRKSAKSKPVRHLIARLDRIIANRWDAQ